MKKLSLLFSLIIIAALGISGCSPKTEETLPTEVVLQQRFLIAEGRLMPANYLEQSFSIPGQVLEILVSEGDNVQIGQVIAKLDVPYEAMVAFSQAQLEVQNAQIALSDLKKTAELNLAQAELDVFNATNSLEEAQEDFDAQDNEENQLKRNVAEKSLAYAEQKLADLKKGNGVDSEKLKAAESRVTTAMTALLAAQSVIDNHQLKSNASGTVAKLNLKVGDRISIGTPVVVYADFANWIVKTDNLTEINVVEIKNGQKVDVVLDALPEKTFTGEVNDIDLVFEEKRGDVTYTVTIKLNQNDPLFRWGMTAAANFLP